MDGVLEYLGGVLYAELGVGDTALGGRPSSFRCPGVRGMSDISSFFRKRGVNANAILIRGIASSINHTHPPYIAAMSLRIVWANRGYLVPIRRAASTIASAATLYMMVLTLLSEKTVARCRLVISASRGCFQLPGLSVTSGASPFVGVLAGFGTTTAVEDILALPKSTGKSQHPRPKPPQTICFVQNPDGMPCRVSRWWWEGNQAKQEQFLGLGFHN